MDVTAGQGQDGAELPAADEQLLRELTERARTGGLKLTGEGGLLGKLTKMVVEGALEGELDDHLGYGKHDPAGRDGGNSRNGHRAKTVITGTGPVEISVPRDRDSSFEPKIVAKRQRFFEPFGRPGPGRVGLGESAGVPIRARSRRKPSRTLQGLRGLAGSGRGCQGRRRSSTRCRARRSWAYAPMARDTHRSVAAAELRCALARPR